jgi:type II secretory pathway pseudopilin PulG
LVVIAIIALLLSILMPSLQKVKYFARRVQCATNIKSQFLYQSLYATDYDGKYSDHADAAPGYAKSPITSSTPPGKVVLYDAISSYFDHSFKIMLCPLLRTPELKSQQPSFADLEWFDGSYGAWGAVKPGQNPIYIYSGYMWFANYTTPNGVEPQYDNFTIDGVTVTNSARWPKNDSEASSSTPFIAHRISSLVGDHFWDASHGGKGLEENTKFEVFSRSQDNPLGYGDGSVTYHKRSKMKPRVKVAGVGVFYY